MIDERERQVSYVHYVHYAQIVAEVGFCSSIFFCFILVYLTMFGVTRNFGTYKYLLILFPVFGIFFATLEVVLYPNVYSHNEGYIYYGTSRPFNLGKDAVTWLLAFYTGVYASTISLLSVQFVYRYWAIFYEIKLRFFKGWRFSFCLLYSLFFGIQWSMGIYHFDKIDSYSRNFFDMEMLQKYSVDMTEISAMALVAYDAEGNLRWWNISCTLNMIFIMLVQYIIISYCAIRMYLDMGAKVQLLSPSLRNLHKQFFKTLVLQIVTPTITLFSPVMLIISLPFLDLEVDLPTGIFTCAFTLYPAMDAIIVMYVVKDYRKAAKHILKTAVGKIHVWLNSAGGDVSSTRTRTINPDVPVVLNLT